MIKMTEVHNLSDYATDRLVLESEADRVGNERLTCMIRSLQTRAYSILETKNKAVKLGLTDLVKACDIERERISGTIDLLYELIRELYGEDAINLSVPSDVCKQYESELGIIQFVVLIPWIISIGGLVATWLYFTNKDVQFKGALDICKDPQNIEACKTAIAASTQPGIFTGLGIGLKNFLTVAGLGVAAVGGFYLYNKIKSR